MSATNRSESIAALAAALAKAQGAIEGASKDKTNPHFKSAYADLASVWAACRDALSKNELAVLQPVSSEGPNVTVTTLLVHSSGEWISEALTMTAAQNTPQGIGSCITYARRYALASMVGIAPEDDDGNAASGTEQPQKAAPVPMPDGYERWRDDISAVAEEGTEKLQEAWKASKAEYRAHLTSTNNAAWEALKKLAASKKVAA